MYDLRLKIQQTPMNPPPNFRNSEERPSPPHPSPCSVSTSLDLGLLFLCFLHRSKTLVAAPCGSQHQMRRRTLPGSSLWRGQTGSVLPSAGEGRRLPPAPLSASRSPGEGPHPGDRAEIPQRWTHSLCNARGARRDTDALTGTHKDLHTDLLHPL